MEMPNGWKGWLGIKALGCRIAGQDELQRMQDEPGLCGWMRINKTDGD